MKCKMCDFKYAGTNCMSGTGKRASEIMIVGTFPGVSEDYDGIPFSGDSGEKLRYLLKKAGIKWSSIYKTYGIKCMPPKGKKPTKKHIDVCEFHLQKEILRIKPKLIIAMGDVALIQTIGESNVGDNRGFFQKYTLDYEVDGKEKSFSCQVMPTYNPIGALRNWEYDDLIVHDLKKGVKYLETNELPRTMKVKIHPIVSLKALKKAKKILLASKENAFDFETTGLNFEKHEIICSIFAPNSKNAYIIPLIPYPKEIYKIFDEKNKRFAKKINIFVKKYQKEIWAFHRDLLQAKNRKVAHNGKFDSKFARKHKFPIDMETFTFDTCIAHSLIDENKPHDLTFILEWFGLVHENYESVLWPFVGKSKKDRKSYLNVPPLILYKYGGLDGCGCKALKPILAKLLKKEKVIKLFRKQQIPYMHMLADMEYKGMKFDITEMNRISKDFQKMIADLEKKTKKLAKNQDFNPGSPKQLSEFFINIDAPNIRKTPTGGFSTNEDVLEKFSNKEVGGVPSKASKMSSWILELRKVTKLKSTYLDGSDGKGGIIKWAGPGNMIHYESNIHTPRTGRISIKNPPLQQIPRFNPKYPNANIRKLFIPTYDYLASVDFKQLEMRIAAFMSKDMNMLKEIRQNVDIHSRNIVMFGTNLGFLPSDMTEKKFIKIMKYEPPKNWEKWGDRKKIEKRIYKAALYFEFRVLAKTIGFGLNYGQTAYTIANNFNREESEVQDMIDMYFEKYFGLFAWRNDMKDYWKENGIIRLPQTNRKRRLICNEWFDSEYAQDCYGRERDMMGVDRQAMNYPIQGYANEIFTAGGDYTGGIVNLYKEFRNHKMRSFITLPIHDGALIDFPKKEYKQLKKLCFDILPKTLGEGTKHEVKLDIDFDVYDRWAGKKVNL